MRILYESRNVAVWPQQKNELTEFVVKNRRLFDRECVLLRASYHCVIPESRAMSRHGVA